MARRLFRPEVIEVKKSCIPGMIYISGARDKHNPYNIIKVRANIRPLCNYAEAT